VWVREPSSGGWLAQFVLVSFVRHEYLPACAAMTAHKGYLGAQVELNDVVYLCLIGSTVREQAPSLWPQLTKLPMPDVWT
jgi:hypothetical protein